MPPARVAEDNVDADSPDRCDWEILPESIGSLADQYDSMRKPVIDGVLRVGEVMNVVAPPKVGKSWLTYSLLISAATGRPWLGQFQINEGLPAVVGLIDNELHRETITQRMKTVAAAMGEPFDRIRNAIDVWSIRGKGVTMENIGRVLDRIEPQSYSLIIGDAWYRLIPPGTSENDNAEMMSLYNQLDHHMDRLDCAWAGVMHSTKGPQSEKSVVDVGAGAGSQARAADAHLVLREHEEPGIYILEAAVRSFPPLAPMALRWEYPLWLPVDDVDTNALKGRRARGEEKQQRMDAEADAAVLETCDTWRSISEIFKITGIGQPRLQKAAIRQHKGGFLETDEQVRRGNPTLVYRKSIHAR